MKANRKFVRADDAVSPVIAVILMVAITVVLAATVFVLVSDIGQNTSKNAPVISWQTDESTDSWSIAQAPNAVLWSDYEIKANTTSAGYEFNGDASPGGTTVTAADTYEALTGTPTEVEGGQTIGFCGPTVGATFTLRHVPSNSQAHSFTFQSLAAC